MNHDAIFKQLLTEFFVEFLDLFCPAALALLDQERISFLDKELFADLADPQRREADLIARVGMRDGPAFFVIHLEHQAQEDATIDRRMFRYFSRLYDREDVPIYPIVLCSYRTPQTPVAEGHQVRVADLTVMDFRYRVVQLNRLDWRAYLRHPNPLAAALMARMAMAPQERMQVKLLCLRQVLGLPLNARRRHMLASFVGMYLRLTVRQEAQVQTTLRASGPQEEPMKDIVEIAQEQTRLWAQREAKRMVILELVERQLAKRLGGLDAAMPDELDRRSQVQLQELAVALLDFTSPDDLTAWLAANPAPDPDAMFDTA